jgi:hypothetical protein
LQPIEKHTKNLSRALADVVLTVAHILEGCVGPVMKEGPADGKIETGDILLGGASRSLGRHVAFVIDIGPSGRAARKVYKSVMRKRWLAGF